MNRLIFFSIAMAFLATAFSGCGGEQVSESSTASEGYDTKKMKAAIAQAKSGIEEFVTALQSGDGSDFAIKEKIVSTGEVNEYVWLSNVEYVNGKFQATVGEQDYLADLEPGAIRTVEKEDVIDWKYEKDGKIYGNYTLRLLIHSMPEDAREPYETEYGN